MHPAARWGIVSREFYSADECAAANVRLATPSLFGAVLFSTTDEKSCAAFVLPYTKLCLGFLFAVRGQTFFVVR